VWNNLLVEGPRLLIEHGQQVTKQLLPEIGVVSFNSTGHDHAGFARAVRPVLTGGVSDRDERLPCVSGAIFNRQVWIGVTQLINLIPDPGMEPAVVGRRRARTSRAPAGHAPRGCQPRPGSLRPGRGPPAGTPWLGVMHGLVRFSWR
jgi:hypothetical protein